MWIEQAGKGGKRKIGRLTALTPERAPAASPHKTLSGPIESQRGRAGND